MIKGKIESDIEIRPLYIIAGESVFSRDENGNWVITLDRSIVVTVKRFDDAYEVEE